MCLIRSGSVVTDDRYAVVWLFQARLYYLYLARLEQKANGIWFANKFVDSLIIKIQGIDFVVMLRQVTMGCLLNTENCISTSKSCYATGILLQEFVILNF